ncbi:MAG TPA: DUF971 domain-containing protein [Pseudomonadales bacterium]
MNTLSPDSLKIRRGSRLLELHYADGKTLHIPFELLRVCSPSAEVRGHSPAQAVLQYGKAEVLINAIEPVGNYAVQIVFDDGHDSGIYTWDYLYQLGTQQDSLWQEYLAKLQAAGKSRFADAVMVFDPKKPA